MPHHTVAVCGAREDAPHVERIARLLRSAGLSPFVPLDAVGAKLHSLARRAAEHGRVVVLVSASGLADGHLEQVVDKVAEREFATAGQSIMIPVDIDGALRTIEPTEPFGPLYGRAAVPIQLADSVLLARLLAALTLSARAVQRNAAR